MYRRKSYSSPVGMMPVDWIVFVIQMERLGASESRVRGATQIGVLCPEMKIVRRMGCCLDLLRSRGRKRLSIRQEGFSRQ